MRRNSRAGERAALAAAAFMRTAQPWMGGRLHRRRGRHPSGAEGSAREDETDRGVGVDVDEREVQGGAGGQLRDIGELEVQLCLKERKLERFSRQFGSAGQGVSTYPSRSSCVGSARFTFPWPGVSRSRAASRDRLGATSWVTSAVRNRDSFSSLSRCRRS